MIANYTNPEIIIPINAFGIDRAIGDMQTKLGVKLQWIEKIFGRCIIQHEVMKVTTHKGVKNVEMIFPSLLSKTGEPYNLMVNDNLTSYCFFVVKDPGVVQHTTNDVFMNQRFIKREISIIFWYNAKKLAPGVFTPFNEELITSVFEALNTYASFQINTVYETFIKVFEAFTIDENMRQYMKYPYSAFRIDGSLTFPMFPENCDPNQPYVLGVDNSTALDGANNNLIST